MATVSTRASLIFSRADRDRLAALDLWPEARFVCAQGSQTSVIGLMEQAIGFHQAAAEPWEAMAAAVRAQLLEAAAWLDSVGSAPFETLRAEAVEAWILFDAWIDQDQFDGELPAEFVAACGRAGLRIQIITND